jgi:hypothetical protein
MTSDNGMNLNDEEMDDQYQQALNINIDICEKPIKS